MHPEQRRRRRAGSGQPGGHRRGDRARPPSSPSGPGCPTSRTRSKLFEEKYPEIDVKVENVGQGLPHYQKLRSAIEAGEGAPDVAQIEYQYIPSFVLPESLLDLTPYGADDLSGDYVDWAWNQVSPDDEVWAIPQDVGPMGNLYREDILAAAGITEPPATWDEYATAAKAVKDATGSYISNLGATQAGQMIGFFWQAGVKPFGYDGEDTVTIDVNSDEAKQVASYWTDLIQQDLISTDVDFNDTWYQGLASGKYAGWLTAAWGPIFLQGTAEDTSGLWRAAPLPQWDARATRSRATGAARPTRCSRRAKNPIAAYELAKFINNDAGVGDEARDRAVPLPAAGLGARGPRVRRPGVGVLRRPEGQQAVRRDLDDGRHRLRSGCRSWTTCTPPTRRRWAR